MNFCCVSIPPGILLVFHFWAMRRQLAASLLGIIFVAESLALNLLHHHYVQDCAKGQMWQMISIHGLLC